MFKWAYGKYWSIRYERLLLQVKLGSTLNPSKISSLMKHVSIFSINLSILDYQNIYVSVRFITATELMHRLNEIVIACTENTSVPKYTKNIPISNKRLDLWLDGYTVSELFNEAYSLLNTFNVYSNTYLTRVTQSSLREILELTISIGDKINEET